MVELTINFYNVEQDMLQLCIVGEHVYLWTRPEIEFIHFYARRTMAGQGLIAKLHKDRVPVLTANLESTTTEILAVSKSACKIMCRIDATEPPEGG